MDRFLAKLIDGVILGVVYGIIAGIVGGALITGYRSGSEVYFYYLIIGVLSSVLYLGYFAYMESSRGQTVGKIVMKLKVFGPDGASNPTMEQAVRRNIWVATGIISIVPFVGWWLGGLASLGAVILIAHRHQRRPREAAALVRQVRRWHPGHEDRLTRRQLTQLDADPPELFGRVSVISAVGEDRGAVPALC